MSEDSGLKKVHPEVVFAYGRAVQRVQLAESALVEILLFLEGIDARSRQGSQPHRLQMLLRNPWKHGFEVAFFKLEAPLASLAVDAFAPLGPAQAKILGRMRARLFHDSVFKLGGAPHTTADAPDVSPLVAMLNDYGDYFRLVSVHLRDVHAELFGRVEPAALVVPKPQWQMRRTSTLAFHEVGLSRFYLSCRQVAPHFAFGEIAERLGDFPRAEKWYRNALQETEGIRDHASSAYVRFLLGDVARRQGNPANASEHFEDALAIFERLGDEQGIAAVRLRLGLSSLHARDFHGAEQLFRNVLAFHKRAGHARESAYAYQQLARVAEATGHIEEAVQHQRDALQLLERIGDEQDVHQLRQKLVELTSDTALQARTARARRHLQLDLPPSDEGNASAPEQAAAPDKRRVRHEPRVLELTADEQRNVSSYFPFWAREAQATGVVRVLSCIVFDGDIRGVADFFFETAPEPIRLKLLHPTTVAAESDVLVALALFSSGQIRTVGEVHIVDATTAEIRPYDYWSLIDPDDDGELGQHSIRLDLHIVGVGIYS